MKPESLFFRVDPKLFNGAALFVWAVILYGIAGAAAAAVANKY